MTMKHEEKNVVEAGWRRLTQIMLETTNLKIYSQRFRIHTER